MKKRQKKGSKSKAPPEEAVQANLEAEDEETEDLDDEEQSASVEEEDDADVVELDEGDLGELIGKALDDRLKPITDSVKTLEKRQKRYQPRLVANLGNPTEAMQDQDEEDPKAAAIRKGMEALNKRRGIVDAAAHEFNLGRAIKALVKRDMSIAPFEFEVSEAISKTLEWADGSSGGLWVAEDFMGEEFVRLYRDRNVMRQAGIQVMSGLTQAKVLIPSISATVEGSWMAQGDTITEDDVTPAQITMDPKICGVWTRLSRLQDWMQTGVQQLLREELAEAMANAVDIAILRGTGTNDQPTGIANHANINTYDCSTGSGDTITLNDLYGIEYELLVDKVPGPYVWVMHPREWTSIRKLTDDNGRPLIVPDPTQASRGFLLGWPIYTTTNCRINLTGDTVTDTGLGEMLLMNPRDVILGEWGTMRIEVSAEQHWKTDEIALKVIQWVDVEMKHATGACYVNDVTAS